MSMLSPRLQLKVSQKQILTPGLVQMVTVLQLNRLELKDMITQEIAANPVLEEAVDGVEELTPEEMQAPSVERAFFLAAGIGYIRVASFDTNTAGEIREAIEKLGGEHLAGLVAREHAVGDQCVVRALVDDLH